MGTYIHIAEVAGLLFAAYVGGWLVGYFTRQIAVGEPRTDAAIPAARLAAATGEPADALVKAPVVEPVSATPLPPLPSMVVSTEPVKAHVAADGSVVVNAAPVGQPGPVSGIATLRALSQTMPLAPRATPQGGEDRKPAEQPVLEAGTAVAAAPELAGPTAVPPAASEVQLDPPVPALEPAIAAAPATLPMPANLPGLAWTGTIGGHEAIRFEQLPDPAAESPDSESPPAGDARSDGVVTRAALHDEAPVAPVDELDDEPSAGLDVTLLASLAEGLKVDQPSLAGPPDAMPATPVDVPSISVSELSSAPVNVAAQPGSQLPAAAAHVEFDEGAAMRAIEGGWSRRASHALPDAPELTDVSAAVAAAQMAVEQVLASSGLDTTAGETRAQAAFGKPRGLSKPREGGRDDLKQINGLSPLDESTLNNLGVFHLDQIALWDEREVLWMENHAFARGRIGRERWQAQARDLNGRAGGKHATN